MATKKRRSIYSAEGVKNALDAVEKGISLREASRTYSIPVATLSLKRRGKVPMEKKPGPPTILTPEEEEQLVRWILFLGGRGFPVTKTQLLDSVQLLVLKTERSTLFTNGRPGRHWYEGFLRRHHNLSIRTAQNLSNTRASVTEGQIRNWFDEVKQHLENLNLMEIDPSRIYNCDESPFMLCPKPDQVIAQRGSKAVYKLVNADEKECLTTLFMVNAAGTTVPPMVMYAYKRIPHTILQNFPEDWQIGVSDKGWMTAETFFEYVSNCFYPWLVKNSIQFPVILYVDGHSSHLTLPLVEFCRSVKIELIALFPNSTHILQPLDVAIFHPLKNAWRNTVNNWRLENCGEKLKREHFAPLLKKALDSTNVEESIRNGFRICGLQPFSPDAVSYDVLNRGNKNPVVEAEPEPNRSDTHLRLFEGNLDEETLQRFKAAKGSAEKIQLTDRGLFAYWLKLKDQSGEKVVRDEERGGIIDSEEKGEIIDSEERGEIIDSEERGEIIDSEETDRTSAVNVHQIFIEEPLRTDEILELDTSAVNIQEDFFEGHLQTDENIMLEFLDDSETESNFEGITESTVLQVLENNDNDITSDNLNDSNNTLSNNTLNTNEGKDIRSRKTRKIEDFCAEQRSRYLQRNFVLAEKRRKTNEKKEKGKSSIGCDKQSMVGLPYE